MYNKEMHFDAHIFFIFDVNGAGHFKQGIYMTHSAHRVLQHFSLPIFLLNHHTPLSDSCLR